MDEPEVLYAVDENIATLTLNASDRLNALLEPLLRGLLDAAARAQGDSAVRAVVLAGAGLDITCAADFRIASRRPRSST
jgi:2-(1,2-epoxy-1,2-dihydrophenyl)acetyl-CoA isomerase